MAPLMYFYMCIDWQKAITDAHLAFKMPHMVSYHQIDLDGLVFNI